MAQWSMFVVATTLRTAFNGASSRDLCFRMRSSFIVWLLFPAFHVVAFMLMCAELTLSGQERVYGYGMLVFSTASPQVVYEGRVQSKIRPRSTI